MSALRIFDELKRRNVYKVAVTYAVVGWLLIQIVTQVFPFFEIPSWTVRLIVLLIALGFPFALVLAWAFELTPGGLKRTDPGELTDPPAPGRTWIYVVTAGAIASLGLFFLGRYSVPRAAGPPGNAAKSIAVLPFESLSEDKANAYFASGIQDEILTRLAKIADLKVISRTSTEQYQSKPGKVSAIAQELGVAHILEGSVQKSGDKVRVNVQLIRADGDTHLWAETYDRELTDIFGVETDVAQRIATSLEAQLTGRERQQLAVIPTRNPKAYDAYLRGLELLKRQSSNDVKLARDLFRQAVALDPSYAQAWAQIAIAETQLYFDAEHTPECLERGRQAAETAVHLQPELSEARGALGLFYYLSLQDYERALIELQAAQKSSPNNPTILFYTGLVKRRQGRIDESIELLKQASLADPRNQDIWGNLGRTYRAKRDFSSAREMFARALAISPDELDFVGDTAETYAAEGDLDAAEKLLHDPKIEGRPGTQGELANLPVYHHLFDNAVTVATKAIAGAKDGPPISAAEDKVWLGGLNLLAGHTAEGRELLEQARNELQSLGTVGDTTLRQSDSLVLVSAYLGDRDEVERQAAALVARTKNDLWRAPESDEVVAAAYGILGDAEHAIPLLRRCLKAIYRRSTTVALIQFDPAWDRIRQDPRFLEVTKTDR